MFAICIACCQSHEIVGKSGWGPLEYEVLPVYKISDDEKKRERIEEPTGQFVTAVPWDHTRSNGETISLPTFDPVTLQCAGCHRMGTVVITLEHGQPCPQCKVGVMQDHGVYE